MQNIFGGDQKAVDAKSAEGGIIEDQEVNEVSSPEVK